MTKMETQDEKSQHEENDDIHAVNVAYSVIRRAKEKNIERTQIINFLKQKGISDSIINEASAKYTIDKQNGYNEAMEENKLVAQSLELNHISGRVFDLIKQSTEIGRVPKSKVISFLKKKDVLEAQIIAAYNTYYKHARLYAIPYNDKPLGFSIIEDKNGTNAIVYNIFDELNKGLGLEVGSIIYEISGKRVDGYESQNIIKKLEEKPVPFYIVFKENDSGKEWCTKYNMTFC